MSAVDTLSESLHSSTSRRLSTFDRRELTRALAAGEVARADLARRFGVSRSYITQFAKMYATDITMIKDQLDDEFAGLWIARKANRVLAHQEDYAAAAGHENFDHHEWIKARTQILHAVAEELGQLPPRATVTVLPVLHVIEGVDIARLA